MDAINPYDIKFIFQNTPDPKTGVSRGWTIGYTTGRKEIVADDVGNSIAKVMEERGKKEYRGQLVTPKGDPLTEAINNGIKINMKELDERVVKKKM